jgi:hypothetical protein
MMKVVVEFVIASSVKSGPARWHERRKDKARWFREGLLRVGIRD